MFAAAPFLIVKSANRPGGGDRRGLPGSQSVLRSDQGHSFDMHSCSEPSPRCCAE